MNDLCEIWNLPWQALQKSVANALGDDIADGAIPAIGSICVQSTASHAASAEPIF